MENTSLQGTGTSQGNDIWQLFWAKTDRSGARPEWTRPLWAHLIDVANAAEATWERVLSHSTKSRLANSIELPQSEAGRWFALQIGLHDIGKAIPCFQSMHKPSRQKLEGAGLLFKSGGYRPDDMVHHGHASIPILIDRLSARGADIGWSSDTIEGLAAMTGYHHGKIVTRDKWMGNSGPFSGRLRSADVLGTSHWQQERGKLLDAVTTAWGASDPMSIIGTRRIWPAWLLEFAGWCTLADWLGSMEESYPEPHSTSDIEGYINSSRRGADSALDQAGFTCRAALQKKSFGYLFRASSGEPREPRPLQSVVIDELEIGNSDKPTLTIIEAPAGEGKTETALYLTLRQQEDTGMGFYIAMPSQATSNGLFGRVESFLARSHNERSGNANLVLVHGTSALHPAQERLHNRFLDALHSMSSIYDAADESEYSRTNSDTSCETRVETASWFMPKKRSLLAPYGVGTVDQVFLGVLYAKHFFLRQIGLAGKTVVFDEVHAYDTYMNALFFRLLTWLRQIGTNVILLSATLPERTRREMIRAWTGELDSSLTDLNSCDSYPVVWHVRPQTDDVPNDSSKSPTKPQLEQYTFLAALSQTAQLHFSSPDVATVAAAATQAAREGATVAVIVNTVARAQMVFRSVLMALQDDKLVPVNCYLFHARYPYELRSETEIQVLKRFGPDRHPGEPAILVATQVAEQSLDIDVDVMFSDLAPIDLLLQRAGRLHRHEDRHKGLRPTRFSTPCMNILVHDSTEGSLPDIKEISGRGKVYHNALLFRTWHLLHTRTQWILPNDYRVLIEGVYATDASDTPDYLNDQSSNQWEAAEKELIERHLIEKREAEDRMIPIPNRLRSIADQAVRKLSEQDDAPAETHPAYLALTRLGGPSFDIVCLHEDATGNLWLNRSCTERMPTGPRLSVQQTRRFMECSVRLSGNYLVSDVEKMIDKRWDALSNSNAALLRYNVMVFRDGHWRSPNASTHFEYDVTYGIIRHTTKER